MTKAELIEKVAMQSGVSNSQAEKVLRNLTNTITNTLSKGDSVTLLGFGTFSVSKRASRTGRNPRTGEIMNMRATNVLTFKAGKSLKNTIKG